MSIAAGRRRRVVPVIVVAGFLGAGKTTLLNHLLRNAEGARIGVIVNDFGAVNVDALLVAGQADGAVSLGNGCMCCTVDADGLEEALVRMARPSADLDAIVIEASGIAEPRTLIRMVTAVADPSVRYGGLVYLVDAENAVRTRRTHPEIDRHIGLADLVVVNKADLAGPVVTASVVEAVQELNPTAPHMVTSDSRVDVGLLFEVSPRSVVDDGAPRQLTLDEVLLADARVSDSRASDSLVHAVGCGHDPHLHDRYESVSVDYDGPLDPRRTGRFLERPPRGVFRVKGVADFVGPDGDEAYVVHAVGGFVRSEPAGAARRAGEAGSMVVIGAGIDVDDVRTRLEALRAEPGLDDEHGILAVTRHLP